MVLSFVLLRGSLVIGFEGAVQAEEEDLKVQKISWEGRRQAKG